MPFLKPSKVSLKRILQGNPPKPIGLTEYGHLLRLVGLREADSKEENERTILKLNEGIIQMHAIERLDTSFIKEPFRTLNHAINAESLPSLPDQEPWNVFQNAKKRDGQYFAVYSKLKDDSSNESPNKQ
ncbi:hypothetical protein POMI540_2258 [Schizosaccharomyces pombe]|uniref:Uncharacterized protein C777.11 n=1 Tax=Schizosaccharomyces pombe (strain 972 / ATCC 24843) TaxID=284812 RepID=YCVB_SCHPO|nr:uncharacterized protein SPCC777.11 [Schizosaccharomyces pombe]O74550.1 RecName: Full=Uncharacterized protein C777.11 [Schizosaccharomyces pombe 972h-]CAA20715.1 sequence orphan [Schizosaccharomyces pombe]|eukprot:NP_588257.1 uncharacterized protein SPCC777.11 [Schizosaccharomyces pombe]